MAADIRVDGIFLSTPSARRATLTGNAPLKLGDIFLSTPSARRATQSGCTDKPDGPISIHALREEGDIGAEQAAKYWMISIHALREEGDYHFWSIARF